MTRLAFVDIETTGLDPDRHEAWEAALILRDDERMDEEHVWMLSVDLSMADAGALRMNHFYDRYPEPGALSVNSSVAQNIAVLTAGAHLVGANPAFDAAFFDRLLSRWGLVPAWHYRLIDVEALAMGYAHGLEDGGIVGEVVDPDADLATASPRGLSTVAAALGITVDQQAKHTAIGDARVARDVYDIVTHRQFGAPEPADPDEHTWTYPERTSTGAAHA